ncbi:MAG: hypothetical protein Fur0043_16320 [Anaerolineales bacterium]
MSISLLVGFLFTVLILSYLLGDNVLFRAAVYIFVGTAAGYAVAVAVHQVIWPSLLQPLWSGVFLRNPVTAAWLVPPLLGSALLLTKISPRLSGWGQIPEAYLAGVGAATVIGGSMLGTLLPQINAAATALDLRAAAVRGDNPLFFLFQGGVALSGAVSVLVYFHFGARRKADGVVRRNPLIEAVAWLGRVYLAITFGLLFAGVYMAALTALAERLTSIQDLFFTLLGR